MFSAAAGVEQQLLRTLVAGRELHGRERFFLGVGLLASEQVALPEIAVRGGLIGRAGTAGSVSPILCPFAPRATGGGPAERLW